MLNNVALDVVIGLILVFLLYGLLVTILSEMVASWLGFRQRMLRLCIERMLNDGYYDHGANKRKKIWHNVKRLFLVEFDQFYTSVAGRFYREPSIKYLAKGDRVTWLSFTNGKPSYIDAGTFAITLIHLMRDKGIGDTDMAKIQYCLAYNTLHFQRETLRGIRAMLTDAGNNLEVFGDKLKDWFTESMHRNTGWYKRMMRLVSFFLGLAIAFTFNIDSIGIGQLLSRDKEARSELVKLAVGVSRDTVLASTAIVDSSLAHVSKDISLANYVLGLGWGFDRLGNSASDTIDGRNSKVIYPGLLELKTDADSVRSWRQEIRRLQPLQAAQLRLIRLQQALHLPADTPANHRLVSLTDSLNNYTALLTFSDVRSYRDISGAIDTLTGKDFFEISSIQTTGKADSILIIYGLTHYSFWQKAGFWWHSIFCSGFIRFLGLLLTAIALSLGAPFWFDMLSKIVAVSGAGAKPNPPKPPKEIVVASGPILINIPAAAVPLVVQPADPLTIAVRGSRTILSGIPGVLSIDDGLMGPKGAMRDVIEIHVSDSDTEARVRKLLNNPYQSFPLNVLITARAKVHLRSGDTIMNQVAGQKPPPTINNGSGTLGCFVKKEGSPAQYLISCWHVLKGDWDWTSHGGPDIITDGDGNNIATVVDGVLSTDMDIGFAQLNSTGNRNSFTKKLRAVSKDDVNQHMTVQFTGSFSGPVTDPNSRPIIFNSSVSITGGLEYPDGVYRELTDMFSITRLVNGTPTPVSDHGDSGSLVLDTNNVPLGILVGADDMFTYVAKLSNILSETGIYKEYQLLI